MNNLPDACTDLDRGLRDLALKIAIEEISKLKKENARLREALEFYASRDCYNLHEFFIEGQNEEWLIVGGKRAREALEGGE